MTSFRLPGAMVALVLTLIASMFLASPVQAQSAAPLKIAYSDWPGWVAWEVAVQKGFFKEEGVNVEFVWLEYLPSMEAFSAGKVDAVCVTNGDALVTGGTGKPSTGIVLNDYSNGNDKIVAKPGINSIKDLKGKKVGLELNLVEHLMLLKALEANGMKESDVTLVNFPTSETPQALSSGGVDAVAAWYPISGQTLKQVAGSKALFTSADAPGLIYDTLTVSRESLATRRADWKKVVKVWFKTLDYIKNPATKDDAIKIMAARVKVTPEEYAKNMEGTFLLDIAGNLKHLKEGTTLESVYGSSAIADAFNVKYKVYKDPQNIKSYIDPSLVMEVAKEMGKAP
jgi:NitT/TauT family transport system substrate-binding protein